MENYQIKEQWILEPGIRCIITMLWKSSFFQRPYPIGLDIIDLQRLVLLGDIYLHRISQSWLSLRRLNPKKQTQSSEQGNLNWHTSLTGLSKRCLLRVIPGIFLSRERSVDLFGRLKQAGISALDPLGERSHRQVSKGEGFFFSKR